MHDEHQADTGMYLFPGFASITTHDKLLQGPGKARDCSPPLCPFSAQPFTAGNAPSVLLERCRRLSWGTGMIKCLSNLLLSALIIIRYSRI